jgi:hypothetical protein
MPRSDFLTRERELLQLFRRADARTQESVLTVLRRLSATSQTGGAHRRAARATLTLALAASTRLPAPAPATAR